MNEPSNAENKYADVHSVLCYAHRRPHDHGLGCHTTCPTCGGKSSYTPPGYRTD